MDESPRALDRWGEELARDARRAARRNDEVSRVACPDLARRRATTGDLEDLDRVCADDPLDLLDPLAESKFAAARLKLGLHLLGRPLHVRCVLATRRRKLGEGDERDEAGGSERM